MLELVMVVLGVALIAVFGWGVLGLRQRDESRAALAQAQTALAVERERTARLAEVEAALEGAQARLNGMETQAAARTATLAAQETDRDGLRHRLDAAETALREKARLETRLATIQETLEQERKQSAEKLALLQGARETMTKEFKLLAGAVMAEHGEAFSKQNKEQIDVVLAPLREKLTEFQAVVANTHTESAKERATLAEQIRQLSLDSATMKSETSNLTRALKGKAQTQGAWGEMILATVLEKSGLRAGEEYITQASHTTDDGSRLRPDVIVNLPGGQRIVIDAKVSLTAFEAHVNAETDEEREMQLQRHMQSLRTHIKTLGGKDYHSHTNGGVDYVIMFLPIEGALAVALQEAPDLTAEAIALNVNIATPTTLMIALRTAASVWQVERRHQNAEAIAARAGALYDKFVGFTEDMGKLGTRLDQAQSVFGDAMGKLRTGNGNLMRQAEELKKLGAKASKALPAALLDAADSEVTISAP